jgi:hypothetical protein
MAFVPRPNMTHVTFLGGISVGSMQFTSTRQIILTVSLNEPPSSANGSALLAMATTAAASAGSVQHSNFVASFVRWKCANPEAVEPRLLQLIVEINNKWLPGYLNWMRTVDYTIHIQYGWNAATVIYPPLFDYVPLAPYF